MRTDFFSITALKTACTVSGDQARGIRLVALDRQALTAEAELTPKPA
jgi:hypothetical protein